MEITFTRDYGWCYEATVILDIGKTITLTFPVEPSAQELADKIAWAEVAFADPPPEPPPEPITIISEDGTEIII